MNRRMAALSLLLIALGGCAGYRFGPAHDESVRTVSVPIWANDTFASDLEFELADALIKCIAESTPWRIVGPEQASTELTGVITEVELRKLSTQRGSGLPQEVAVRMTVDFTWTDTRTGQVLVARRDFTASDSFVPAVPVQERVELGQYAVVQKLARDIVAELRSNW